MPKSSATCVVCLDKVNSQKVIRCTTCTGVMCRKCIVGIEKIRIPLDPDSGTMIKYECPCCRSDQEFDGAEPWFAPHLWRFVNRYRADADAFMQEMAWERRLLLRMPTVRGVRINRRPSTPDGEYDDMPALENTSDEDEDGESRLPGREEFYHGMIDTDDMQPVTAP